MIFAAEDLKSDNPRPTPLFSAAASVSKANVWTSVNGWTTARLYTSIEEEYEAASHRVAVLDMGAIARYSIRGKDAGTMLSRATSVPASSLELGESARGLILSDEGEVIDHVETTNLSDDFFLMAMTHPHARRLRLAARGFDVEVKDITGEVAIIGLIGPDWRKAVSAIGIDVKSDHLAAQGRMRGVEIVARPFHLGRNDCIELIFPMEEALTIWERIDRSSKPAPIGLDAFDLLRIEAGVPRPGTDFISAEYAFSDAGVRRPAELGLSHLAPLDRGWFNGRSALKHPKGARRRAVTVLAIDADYAAPGAAVFAAGKPVGRITSSAFSPHLKRVVAFADLAPAALRKTLEVSMVSVDGRRLAASLFETPERLLALTYRENLDQATETRR